MATGYRKPLDLAPSVATVITEDDIQAIGATTLGRRPRAPPVRSTGEGVELQPIAQTLATSG